MVQTEYYSYPFFNVLFGLQAIVTLPTKATRASNVVTLIYLVKSQEL